MKSYDDVLFENFKNLKVELVHFDNGATPESMAAYILVSGLTPKMLKDKGSTALDLGNYLYRRYGLQYEMVPEYHRQGEAKNSIAFYVSKFRMDKMLHVKEWLLKVHNQTTNEPVKRWESALYRGQRFTVQSEAA